MSYKFIQVANEVIRRQEKSKATLRQWKALLVALQPLHDRHVAEIEPHDVFAAVQAIETRGARHMAHRAGRFVSLVCRYAIATNRRKAPDPAGGLVGLLKPMPKAKGRAAATTVVAIREVLAGIEASTAEPVTKAALRFLPLVFVRPGEMRGMRWSEIDLEKAVWRIPAERMKMRRDHLVPLSRQALAILDEMLLEHPSLVFPGRDGPLSANTLNEALVRARVGRGHHTPHGWRACARTVLAELGESREILELQLAHKRGSATEQAYDRAEFWEQRVALMQRWADWLDGVKARGD